MDTKRFAPGDAIRFGWEKAKANLNLVIILTLVAAMATGIPSAIAEGIDEGSPELAGLFRLAGAIISLVVTIGAIRISLRLHDGGTATVRDLFAVEGSVFWRYLVASILYSLIVNVGLIPVAIAWLVLGPLPSDVDIPWGSVGLMLLVIVIPLVILGIILGVRYVFYGYAVVDRNARPRDALAQSAAATRGVWRNVSLFGLAIILLNILGALALGIGLLITAPVSALATAWVYRRLTGPQPAPAAAR